MALWFTSDLHLSHVRAPELCGRPYGSTPDEIQRMNQDIIAAHNEVVGPNDHVIYLGDVCMGKIAESLPLVDQLNGWKTLVLGNHDRISPLYHNQTPENVARFKDLYTRYFDAIITDGVIQVGDQQVQLHHMPYLNSYDDVNHAGWLKPQNYPVDDGKWLIHGHVHGLWRQKGRMINVGIDAWGNQPVSEATLIYMMQEGPCNL